MLQAKQRENNRAAELLDAAAVVFAEQGYSRTTIREITSAAGMGPGSSYYHFASKAEMLLAVYDEGVRTVTAEVTGHLEGVEAPWDRLSAALEGHISAVLAPTAYARVIVTVLPGDVPEVADDLRRLRDAYELVWKELVDDLGAGVDGHLLRLFLLGAANATQIWFQPGAQSPAEIASAFVGFLHRPLERS